MSNSDSHSTAHRCTCRKGADHRLQPPINRRQFIALGSGCVLGGLVAVSNAADGKAKAVNIGALKSFNADGISEQFIEHDFFVMRYQGKLFAASNVCPHMGGTLARDPNDSSRIICRMHESVFNSEGMVMVAPASSGMVRLGISVNAEGQVVVDPSKEFPQDKWEDKASFIEVK